MPAIINVLVRAVGPAMPAALWAIQPAFISRVLYQGLYHRTVGHIARMGRNRQVYSLKFNNAVLSMSQVET